MNFIITGPKESLLFLKLFVVKDENAIFEYLFKLKLT